MDVGIGTCGNYTIVHDYTNKKQYNDLLIEIYVYVFFFSQITTPMLAIAPAACPITPTSTPILAIA